MLVEIWVTLQREAVADPEFYYAVKNPVVRLLLALYGHPDSPTFWEDYCNGKVKLVGFNSMGAEWPSMFWHPRLRLLLSVYADDFKMAGPQENLA